MWNVYAHIFLLTQTDSLNKKNVMDDALSERETGIHAQQARDGGEHVWAKAKNRKQPTNIHFQQKQVDSSTSFFK